METGTLIADRFKILDKLGQGGFGFVYLARNEISGVKVALKTVPAEMSRDNAEMDDLRRNFQLIHTLHHPNIAAPLHLEWDQKLQTYFLVMEYVEGTPLSKYRRSKKGGKLPLAEAFAICRQIAEALEYAHRERIVHRDIKPQNVMITSKGEVKVLDFGLATQIRSTMTRLKTRTVQTPVGTYGYMAPELFRGQEANEASDQYALAALCHELVSGKLPFICQSVDIMRTVVLEEPVKPLTELTPEQNEILLRALAKEPEARHASVLAFARALEETLKPAEPVKQPDHRLKYMAMASAVALASGGLVWHLTREPAPEDVVQSLFSVLKRQEGKVRSLAIPSEFSGCPEWLYEDYKTAIHRQAGVEIKERRELQGVIKDIEDANALVTDKVKAELRRSAQADAVLAGRCVLDKIYLRLVKVEDGSGLGAADARMGAASLGRLSVRSDPAGAEVRLDGVVIGTTPMDGREIPAGSHELRLEKRYHLPEKQPVVVGRQERVERAFTLKRGEGRIQITSKPTGATILLDGVSRKESTPATLEAIPAGQHTVQLRHGECGESRHEVEVLPGDLVKLLDQEVTGADQRKFQDACRPEKEISRLKKQAQEKLDKEKQDQEKQAQQKLAQEKLDKEKQDQEKQAQQKLAQEKQEKERQDKIKATTPTIKPDPKPGDIWQEPKTGMEFVFVPGGCFQMGMSEQEKQELKSYQEYEKSFKTAEYQHRVCVDSLWVGKTEVTVGQFRKFVTATGYETDAEKNPGTTGCNVWQSDTGQWGYESRRSWFNPGYIQEEAFPVVCVSWMDADAFAKWVSSTMSGTIRMLTEAEWEYAARAGTTTQRYWGDNPNDACRYANVADQTKSPNGKSWNNPKHECSDGYFFSAPVGMYRPNAFGLYDMLGNVWEWTCSLYGEYNDVEKKHTRCDGKGSNRIMRGGGSGSPPATNRLALRFRNIPNVRYFDLGFRLTKNAH